MQEGNFGDILIQKCHRGKLQDVKALIEEGKVDINYRNEVHAVHKNLMTTAQPVQNGCTALHGAAAAGQLEVMQWLIKHESIGVSTVDDVRVFLFFAWYFVSICVG